VPILKPRKDSELSDSNRLISLTDISGAYDNVLIDILDILREKEVPLPVVRILFRLLWWKELAGIV
jgi:hypothetical protein